MAKMTEAEVGLLKRAIWALVAMFVALAVLMFCALMWAQPAGATTPPCGGKARILCGVKTPPLPPAKAPVRTSGPVLR